MKTVSLADYARHRGCSRNAVTKAVQSGRLSDCIVRGPTGRPSITSVELADEEWARYTRTTSSLDTPEELAAAGLPSLAASRARREAALAGIATLELMQKKGKLVSVEGARSAVEQKFHMVKTRLLEIPTRVKNAAPELTADHIRTIDELVRAALDELSRGPSENQD